MPAQLKESVIFKEASVISSELEQGNADIALIPSCDLLKHSGFFVSSKIAISFDGFLSNAYFYFLPDQNKFTDIFLSGDVTTNEIILSKILFKEKYSSDVQMHLDTGKADYSTRNYLVVGDSNLDNSKFDHGLSFSDELSEMLFLPYVNFIAVSKDEAFIQKFNEELSEIDVLIEDNVDTMLHKFSLNENSRELIKNNLNSVYFEMTDSEVDGLKELLQLPYYHGLLDDMVEIKFV